VSDLSKFSANCIRTPHLVVPGDDLEVGGVGLDVQCTLCPTCLCLVQIISELPNLVVPGDDLEVGGAGSDVQCKLCPTCPCLVQIVSELPHLVVPGDQGWAPRSFTFRTHRSFPFIFRTKRSFPFIFRVFGDL
jgi:hypothetical protein